MALPFRRAFALQPVTASLQQPTLQQNSNASRYSLTEGYGRCMQVWDVRSNQLVQHYSAHSGPVTNVAFHPSGDFLLSSSLDTTLKVQALAATSVVSVGPSSDSVSSQYAF